jgi:hypothetical protein
VFACSSIIADGQAKNGVEPLKAPMSAKVTQVSQNPEDIHNCSLRHSMLET